MRAPALARTILVLCAWLYAGGPARAARLPAHLLPPARPVIGGYYQGLGTRQIDYFGDPEDSGLGHFQPPLAEAAQAELARLEQAGEGGSLKAAEVVDYLVDRLLRYAEYKDPDTAQLARRAVAIRDKLQGPDHFDVAGSLGRLGLVLEEKGDLRGAERAYTRALSILLPRDDSRSATLMACRLANLLSRFGDLVQARRLLDQRLWDQATRPAVLVTVAGVLISVADFDAARAMLEPVLSTIDRDRAPVVASGALNNMALVHAAAGEWTKARRLLEESLFIEDHVVHASEHPRTIWIRHNLALILMQMGEVDAAWEQLELAAVLHERIVGPEHPELALTLVSLANARLLRGDSVGAGPLYDRALGVLRREGMNTYLPYGLASAAWFQWVTGNAKKAAELSLEAESPARARLLQLAAGLSEREALRYEAIRTSGIDMALSYLASPTGRSDRAFALRVWNEIVRSRALVLDTMARRHRALSDLKDPAVLAGRSQLEATREALGAVMLRAVAAQDPDLPQDEIGRLRLAEERIERFLAEAGQFVPPPPEDGPDLRAIAATLPSDSALVAFVQYQRLPEARVRRDGNGPAVDPALPSGNGGTSFLALVLRPPREAVEIVPLSGAGLVDEQVRSWLEASRANPRQSLDGVAGAERRYHERGAKLYETIWKPLRRSLARCRQVFVVPDGSLHLVNLGTLPIGGGRYLLEDGPLIRLVSAERDLIERRRPTIGASRLMLLGAPDFDTASAAPSVTASTTVSVASARVPVEAEPPVYRGPVSRCDRFRTLEFDPVPGAAREVEAIADLWRKRHGSLGPTELLVLTGPEASEGRFKRTAHRFRGVHLATHGFSLQGNCDSLLDQPGALPTRPAENPLVLAGIALAGANRRESRGGGESEDGILTAEEIASLDLRQVNWVVLSGCETGLGEIRKGEGVFGLRRAFEVAGAGALIMSLWPVEDQATSRWMTALYAARLDGRTTAEAMRQASLQHLSQARARGATTHPFQWGAFVAVGGRD